MFQRGEIVFNQPAREELATPTRLGWRRRPDLVAATTVGAVILLGACLYRRVRHPE
jgi:hypothetical protein